MVISCDTMVVSIEGNSFLTLRHVLRHTVTALKVTAAKMIPTLQQQSLSLENIAEVSF